MAPIVDGKHFPYTKAGKRAAKLAKRKKIRTSDGYIPGRAKN